MAKNTETLNDSQVEETAVSEVKATEKGTKVNKKDKKVKKQKGNDQPKKSRIKETFGELKKVTWPSFGKAMKQTGMVLLIVAIFGVLVFGIDTLVSFIISKLSSF